jgi:hypothetical protein
VFVDAFVCFSGKKMPVARKFLLTDPMPSPTCCYCGTRIKEARRLYVATPEQLADAAVKAAASGQAPRAHAKHLCATHAKAPPQIAERQTVRSTHLQHTRT